jgi:lipopolysaccharide heptosyltransferase II
VKIDRSRVHKILVIKLRAIGDVLLSTVVLENLRSAFPQATIDFLTEKPSRDVIEGNPAVHGILIFDSKVQSGISLIARVRARRYDLVIDLFGNPRSALVTLFSGAPYRVGYRFKWRQYCYNIVVEPRGGEKHNTEFNLDALRAMDLPISKSSIFFPVGSDAIQFAERFFRDQKLSDRFVVALNPGGGWYTKRWPLRQFAEFGDLVAGKLGAQTLVIWGPGELPLAEEIQRSMRHPSILIPPCGLKELGAVLRRCRVMVTNDSGPMHIAAATGTPVVAIFGPTRPHLQGPFGNEAEVVQNQKLFCLGCNLTKCPIGNPCMEDLSVEKVFEGFTDLMHKTKNFGENILQ